MDAFKTHEQVISKYRNYLTSFINIADERIKKEVADAFNSDGLESFKYLNKKETNKR